jgi:hypothetical protein|tara:strand:- start:738 stop:854 length:117 start_codon:yes stop_codon:yes gene_type:complete
MVEAVEVILVFIQVQEAMVAKELYEYSGVMGDLFLAQM